MKLTPQILLTFDGQCEAAFKLYERAFDAAITFMMTWGNSPAAGEVGAGWAGKIYHATLKIGDVAISGGDPPPEVYKRPQGFEILLQMDEAAAAERIFQSLAEEGQALFPLQETFWAKRFGTVVDRFGIRWSINCEHAGGASQPVDV
jgi:PhnB protein